MRRLVAFVTGAVMLMGAAACSLDGKNSSLKKATDSDIKNLIGEWEMEGEKNAVIAIESSSSAWIGAATDYSSHIRFNADGTFRCGGENYTKDQYTFVNGEFDLNTPDGHDMSMKKIDGDNDNIYGDYQLKSGDVYKTISKGYKAKAKANGKEEELPKEVVVGLSCIEGKTEIQVRFPAEIEIYGDTLFLDLKSADGLESNMNLGTCTYKVVGDKLYLKKGDDTKFTLHRRTKFGEEPEDDEDDEDFDSDSSEDPREAMRKKAEKEKASMREKFSQNG